jgi:hypothetical protein
MLHTFQSSGPFDMWDVGFREKGAPISGVGIGWHRVQMGRVMRSRELMCQSHWQRLVEYVFAGEAVDGRVLCWPGSTRTV